MNKVGRAVIRGLTTRPSARRRMAVVAAGTAIYASLVLALSPHDMRDGLWALCVFAALLWGSIESGRAPRPRRSAAPDPQSQIKLLY